MNGDERRRNEIMHPESALTSGEIQRRKEILGDAFRICKSICFSFMVAGAFIVAYVASQHKGTTGFTIAFLGTLIVVALGMAMAYNLGNKMQRQLSITLKEM